MVAGDVYRQGFAMSGDAEHYNEVAAHYDGLAGNGPYATLAPHNHGGRKSEYVAAVFDAAIMAQAQKYSPYKVLLDFGCGTGLFTKHAADMAEHVVGVDVSDRMLQVADEFCRTRRNVSFFRMDGERLALPDSSVDCVVARESLCYVADERLPFVLAEIGRVMKQGGVFLWLDQLSVDPYWQQHPKARALVKRSPEALLDFARATEFQLASQSVVRTPRFPWVFPIWFGVVPRRWIPVLARLEVAWHGRFGSTGRRWWNSLFVFHKSAK